MITFDPFLLVVFVKLCPECCVNGKFGPVNSFILFSIPSCNRAELGTGWFKYYSYNLSYIQCCHIIVPFFSQYVIHTKCFQHQIDSLCNSCHYSNYLISPTF